MLDDFFVNISEGNADSQMLSMEALANFREAYKELQKSDKEQVENLSKIFFNSGATFHTQLMRNITPSILKRLLKFYCKRFRLKKGYSLSPFPILIWCLQTRGTSEKCR
jgi:hypothetical protein